MRYIHKLWTDVMETHIEIDFSSKIESIVILWINFYRKK
jgi:hypothetical protein